MENSVGILSNLDKHMKDKISLFLLGFSFPKKKSIWIKKLGEYFQFCCKSIVLLSLWDFAVEFGIIGERKL